MKHNQGEGHCNKKQIFLPKNWLLPNDSHCVAQRPQPPPSLCGGLLLFVTALQSLPGTLPYCYFFPVSTRCAQCHEVLGHEARGIRCLVLSIDCPVISSGASEKNRAQAESRVSEYPSRGGVGRASELSKAKEACQAPPN